MRQVGCRQRAERKKTGRRGCPTLIAMTLEAAHELECAALGALLREPREAERTLLLDCRPFLAFCRRHVRAARPVPWNALLRRRVRGPPAAALACLLPDRALRARLARGELARVVVLDEGSASVAELWPDGPARVLLTALLHETRSGSTAVCFLRGEHRSRMLGPPGTPSSSTLSLPQPSPPSRLINTALVFPRRRLRKLPGLLPGPVYRGARACAAICRTRKQQLGPQGPFV